MMFSFVTKAFGYMLCDILMVKASITALVFPRGHIMISIES